MMLLERLQFEILVVDGGRGGGSKPDFGSGAVPEGASGGATGRGPSVGRWR